MFARTSLGAGRWIHHVAERAVTQQVRIAAAAVRDVDLATQATALLAGAVAAERWRRRWWLRGRRRCGRVLTCVGRPNEELVVAAAGEAAARRQLRHRAQPPALCITLGRRFIRTHSGSAAVARPRSAADDRISEGKLASSVQRRADRAHHQPVCRAPFEAGRKPAAAHGGTLALGSALHGVAILLDLAAAAVRVVHPDAHGGERRGRRRRRHWRQRGGRR